MSSIWSELFNRFSIVRDIRDTMKILEHYHHGLALLAASMFINGPLKLILIGLGAQLVSDERVHSHPFAIGKSHFRESSILGICLLSIVLISMLLQV